MTNSGAAGEITGLLLDWYDRSARALPWRQRAGAPDPHRVWPYRVWLAEIMLQQTTVATVIPYYQRFLARWPDIEKLAVAGLDDVLHAWQGLGYYARARNLHKCAGVVARDLGGRFPATARALRELPGIGPYTSAAIAAIAFGEPVAVVDGNVERVISRLYAITGPLPGTRPIIGEAVAGLVPRDRPGDFAQALMDLGALLCRPRAPACGDCPLSHACRARARGIAETLPARPPKTPRPRRHGIVYWAERAAAGGGGREVLLRRRPERGLLGGMMEFPSRGWNGKGERETGPPLAADWRPVEGIVRHTFTHFYLDLDVMTARIDGGDGAGLWWPVRRLDEQALPTVMKKVARLVLG